MSERRIYDLTLKLRSPFMFEGTVNTRTGVDSAYLRDHEGRPIIPSTQIRGVMRAALGELARATGGSVIKPEEIAILFGSPSSTEGEGSDAPARGCMILADLTGPQPGGPHQTTRIEIEDSSGIVKRGSLQVIELAAPLGSECLFAGSLVVRFPNSLDATRIEAALAKALALIPSIGAYKSAGFGEVLPDGSSFKERSAERFALAPSAGVSAAPVVQWYELVLDRPLTVDAHRVAENIFESSTIIPGAAIKGAMARRLELAGLIDERQDSALISTLAQLVVSHAFPVDPLSGAVLDLPLPLSVLTTGGAFADAIMEMRDTGAVCNEEPVEFAFNAKPKTVHAARSRLSLLALKPVKLSRTHVKIDETSLTAADGQLFAIVAISNKIPADHPDNKSSMMTDLRWRFRVNTGNCADANEVQKLLSMFSQPLDGIGRSGSTASIKATAEPSAFGDARKGVAGNVVNVVLRTPALLTGPREGQSQKTIFDAHAEYFAEKLSGAKLVNIFARREMAGGYIATRRRVFGKSTYYPFVLTAAGSVFRLDVSAPGARNALENALKIGLPAADIFDKRLTWRDCAYVPENGYGEIALHDLNLPSVQGLEFIGGV